MSAATPPVIVHGVGLMSAPGPPFVRFERESDSKFAVWVSAPPTVDLDALNVAVAMAELDESGKPATVHRWLAGYFGWILTPDEDALSIRYQAQATGPSFWADVDAAGLRYVPAEGAPGALQLAGMPRAIALVMDLARGPVFSPRVGEGDDVQLALTTTVLGSLHNKPFTITTKDGIPEVRDGLLLSELIKRYVDQGLPGSRNVTVTTTELCDAAGYGTRGGRQFRLAVDALIRLRSATLENAVRLEDGSQANYVWGMVDAGWMRSGPEGSGQVRLSQELVGMVRRGLLVYYDRETLRGLVDADRYAARLWMFLEGESLGDTPRRYSVFSAPRGAPPAERDTPAIADLLDLREKRRPDDPTGWARRRDIVRRIRRAAAVLHELDARYVVTVEQAKSHPSMKNLCVSRHRVPSVAPPVDNPSEVCTPGRAPCVLPVAPLCTPGRALGGESPAHHESNESAPSVLPSVTTVKDLNGDSDRKESGRSAADEEQSLKECPLSNVRALLDPGGTLAAPLVDTLAAAVCSQLMHAAGSVTCEARKVECRGAFVSIGAQLAEKIAAGVLHHPGAYIRRMCHNAANDPAELIGEDRLKRLRTLDKGTTATTDERAAAEAARTFSRPD